MAAVDFPNLRHLRTFEAVARLESLGRAATELNRTQPGITQTIAKLEADFAVALMERRYSGTYLTECGRVLLARTIRLLSHLSMALSEPSLVAAAAEPARTQSMIGKVTTSHIRCLIAFSEGNSVGAAAELAGISNSSLVRKIRELEQIIGRRLTRNTAQGGSLHPHGVELARRLKLAATEIEFAREEIAALSGVVQTRIKIGAMPHCAILVLVGAIDEFLRRQPGAHVTLEQKPYDTLLDDLRAGKIDFLFGVLRKPEWARDVEELPLFSNPYAIVVGRHHPLARKRSVTLEDLVEYDWVLPQPGTPRREAFEQIFKGHGAPPSTRIETSVMEILVTLIANSDRVTMMSTEELKRIAHGGEVVALSFNSAIRRGYEGIATREGWQPTAGKRLFLEVLRERARSSGLAAVTAPAE